MWLNGAFGVGKTSTARRLLPLLAGAGSYDPERLGWLLQHTVGRMQRGDFQHLGSWRRGTTLLIRLAATQWRRGHVEIYAEVRHELAARGSVVDTTERSREQVAAAVAHDLVLSWSRSESPVQPPECR